MLPYHWLRLGSAQLQAGYLSNVVIHPNFQQHGIGTALTKDAINYAHNQGYALLIGHAIPNFYNRFGFADIFDITYHVIQLKDILAQSPSPYQVRPATLNDVPILLELYKCHYEHYVGSVLRNLKQQEHQLQYWLLDETPLLVLDANNHVHGYLMLFWNVNQPYAAEVAADNWLATLALLQYQAHLLNTSANPPKEFSWVLPLDSPTFYLLTDHLSIRSETHSLLYEDWMARPIHLPHLFQSLIPLWEERWRCYTGNSPRFLGMMVDNHNCFLELGTTGVRLVEHLPIGAELVNLSLQVFTQLLFGYRPISWAAVQSGQHIPRELISLLTALYPLGRAWITETNMGLTHIEER